MGVVNDMNIKNILIIPDINNIDESIKLANTYHCGFEYNDFFVPALLDDKERLRKTVQFYKNLDGIPEYCTSHGAFLDVTVFSDDAKIREASDYRVEQSLNIAEELGAKAVVFHTNYMPNFKLETYRESWVERNVEYWSEKLMRHRDLNIYMENMFDTDWILLVALADRLKDNENFGICFDYAHAHAFGDEGEIHDWVTGVVPYVKHLHVNDNDFKADLHLALGEGCIDWERFRGYYDTVFSDASVLVEMRGNEKIRKSLDFIKNL